MQPSIFFGSFRLEPDDRRLWRGGEPVHLTPKAYAVLSYLLSNPARLVTKDELLDAVWQRRYVSEGLLKACIREIRKALDDDSRAPRYIETRHRLGYRFMAEVAISAPTLPVCAGRETQPDYKSRAAAPVPIIEREAVLDRLAAYLARAEQGARQIVFLAGEAGIGKTTVLEEFLARLRGRGQWIAQGRCLDHHGSGEAYLPLLEALSAAAAGADADFLTETLRRHAPTWLAQLPSLTSREEREQLRREILGATRDRMLRELAEALEALAADRTVVLALEDLHWSDYATCDLLAFLGRRPRPARLLVLGTYRQADAALAGHPLQAVQQDLDVHGQCAEIALGALTAEGVATYLAARFPGSALPTELAEGVHRRTEGNPLFVVTLVSFLVAQGVVAEIDGCWRMKQTLAEVDLGVPENLRQMVAIQMSRLDADEQRVLEAASVVGLELASSTVATALDEDAQSIEACCETLAARGQFLRPCGVITRNDGMVAGRYVFLHALHRSALYERIGAARRAQLHLRIGVCLECLYGNDACDHAAALALHFERGHAPARAIEYLGRAAENAARQFANTAAIAYLERALGLLGGGHPYDPARRLALHEQLGLLRRAQGYDLPGAVRDFALLATEAATLGRHEVQVRALLHLAMVFSWFDLERCLATAGEAVTLSQAVPDELLQAHAKGCHGHWRALYREWSDSDADASERALALARNVGDRRLVALHAGNSACNHFLQSRYDAACTVAEEAMGTALEVGDAFEYMRALFYRAMALLHIGRWGETWQAAHEGIGMAEKNGHPFWAILFRLEVAWLRLHALDFDGARVVCEQLLDEAEQLDYTMGRSLCRILLGHARAGLGEHRRAALELRAVAEQPQDARTWVDWPLRIPAYLGLADCLYAQGRLTEAMRVAKRVCTAAARPGQLTFLSLGALTRARIAIVRGDYAAAERTLERTLTKLEGRSAPLAAWRVHALAARLHTRRGRLAAAAAAWRESEAVVEALAASLVGIEPLHAIFCERRTSGAPQVPP